MAFEIILPKVDMVMETGTFVEWLKQEGEAVQKGDPLFVIQTDKAAIEIESPESGILSGLLAKADDVIPVTQVIGYLLQPGETLSPRPAETGSPRPLVPAAVSGQAKPSAGSGAAPDASAGEGVRATPLARGLARELQLDLSQVSGSGPRGRIYRADVERYLASAQPPSAAQEAALREIPARLPIPTSPMDIALPLPEAREKKRVPLKGAREIIARRMAYSAATIPHVHLTIQVDMSEAARMRQMINPVHEKQSASPVSYTAVIARAVVRGLKKHPFLNSTLSGGEIILWEDIHLGIATQVEETLVVPVVREAQDLDLEEIAREIDRLVGRARSRKLQPSEMSGSTFTITNLGMMGISSFTAIINPPETAILAVGKILDTPVAVAREVVIRPVLNLTLAVDHRVIDGALAAAFLADLKSVLENPYLLI